MPDIPARVVVDPLGVMIERRMRREELEERRRCSWVDRTKLKLSKPRTPVKPPKKAHRITKLKSVIELKRPNPPASHLVLPIPRLTHPMVMPSEFDMGDQSILAAMALDATKSFPNPNT